MISFNELEKGKRIIIDGFPWEILEASHMVKGRGQSVIQGRLKNLKNGNIISKTFRSSDSFKEADIKKLKATFLYKNNKNVYFFCKEGNPKDRFFIEEDKLGSISKFLKEGSLVEGIIFEDEIINISLPVKINLKVIEAPPGIKGDRAQSGTKPIKLETGAEILAPLFIKEGDIVEINTEKEEYSKRL